MKWRFFLFLMVVIFVSPVAVRASFDRDLFYGVQDNDSVRELQQFLKGRGLYAEEVTGNFLNLTRAAVSAFQRHEGIVPARGFFGPLTRARASDLLVARSDTLSTKGGTVTELQNNLLSQIQALQGRLVELRARLAAEQVPQPVLPPVPTVSAPVVVPAPVASSTPSVPPIPPAPIAELRISGSWEQPFPNTMITPLKIGDITITNHTGSAASFAQLELDIHDAMNSTLNRNRTVKFLIRNGTSTSDTLIKTADFVINNDPPPVGSSWRRQVNLPFPITLAADEEQTFGLWVELLDYVISGSLTVELFNSSLTTTMTPVGGFHFVLTR